MEIESIKLVPLLDSDPDIFIDNSKVVIDFVKIEACRNFKEEWIFFCIFTFTFSVHENFGLLDDGQVSLLILWCETVG